MHLDKQPDKNQNTKNPRQRYIYSSKNTIFSFKQAKCCKVCPLENFKDFDQNYIFVYSQLASQPANRDRPSAYTTGYMAFKLSGNKL